MNNGHIHNRPVVMRMPRLSRYWFTACSIASPSSCFSVAKGVVRSTITIQGACDPKWCRCLSASFHLPTLEKGRYVTANSLQNYLTKELPRTLRKVFTKPKVQTPWFHGSHTADFLIADLQDVLKQRSAVKPGYEQVKQVFLQFEQSVDIDDISGFSKKRGHFVPDRVSGASESFVEEISQQEVQEEFQKVFERIRTSMNYKRRDLTAKNGRIITPDFEFSVTCTQDRDDPTSALITRTLINISPTIVGDKAFNEVFDNYFDELTFDFNKSIDIEHLIDHIEDLESDKIDVSYPADCSECEIEIKDSPFTIKVTPGSLTIQTPGMKSTKLLLETFFDVQKQLSATPMIKAIAASST